MSLSILGPNLGEIPENGGEEIPGSVTDVPPPPPTYLTEKGEQPGRLSSAPSSAAGSTFAGDEDELMASLSRANSRGKGNKIHKILGTDAPNVAKSAKGTPNEGSNKAWYLNYDYSQGGKLDALMERLTLHDQMDPGFLQTFLLTYRSFTTSKEFEGLLEKRFTLAAPEGLTEEEFSDWDKKKRKIIQLRVFNVMKSWIENYCQEDPEDREVLNAMTRFAMTTMQEAGAQTLATQLVKLVERWEQSGGAIRKMVQSANPNRIRFLDLDPLEVARQLTVLESREYNKLQPVEFLLKAWSDKESVVAVNVKTMILMSNQVAGWVAQSILSEKEVKKRAHLIKHFINIAEKCRGINNFNTLITFPGIAKHSTTLNPPCVPFLGFYLTDLTFIEDGSPNFLKGMDGMINFSKRMKTAEVIREIQQYQNAPYQLTHQSFMETADETDLYNMSLMLEPREREDEKIARLLTESGFL
ncbi:ras guanine nucleotide exchange factor domain-containing protein [Chytridium lagenaria]|nr:ras guanine nucleotide exchange factor domain-containing protein [Chytridium lagenaria]